MIATELDAKQAAWLKYRAAVYKDFQESLNESQKILQAEYIHANQELSRIRTWRKHKPNPKKKIPKIVLWPPE